MNTVEIYKLPTGKWKFRVRTGKRSPGIVSTTTYEHPGAAERAARNFMYQFRDRSRPVAITNECPVAASPYNYCQPA